MLAADRSLSLPTSTSRPPTSAHTPWPVMESKAVASGRLRPRSLAPVTMADASGCSEDASTAATSVRSSCGENPGAGSTSVSEGAPLVMVPVLSSTTVSSLCAFSSASAERIRMPFVAPLPVPTVIDMGVARPSAHGQAMISTDTVATSAKIRAGGGPTIAQTAKVQIAIMITAGTK